MILIDERERAGNNIVMVGTAEEIADYLGYEGLTDPLDINDRLDDEQAGMAGYRVVEV